MRELPGGDQGHGLRLSPSRQHGRDRLYQTNKAAIVHDNILIDTHMLEAARIAGVSRFLYALSACIYPGYLQNTLDVAPLREEDAYPADAEDGYGWQKLMAERLCRHYDEGYGLATYAVRFYNIFGPLGTWDKGREKSPAAICRKVALAADGEKIEVWGDGEQTCSCCYVSDCVEDIYRLLHSDHHDPINLGQDRMVPINELVDMAARIGGKTIKKGHDFSKPQGVRGRNADISLMRSVLGWEPQVRLEDGLTHTYAWIKRQLAEGARHPAADEAKGSGQIVTMTGRHGIERVAGSGAVPVPRSDVRPCLPGVPDRAILGPAASTGAVALK